MRATHSSVIQRAPHPGCRKYRSRRSGAGDHPRQINRQYDMALKTRNKNGIGPTRRITCCGPRLMMLLLCPRLISFEIDRGSGSARKGGAASAVSHGRLFARRASTISLKITRSGNALHPADRSTKPSSGYVRRSIAYAAQMLNRRSTFAICPPRFYRHPVPMMFPLLLCHHRARQTNHPWHSCVHQERSEF